MAREVDTGKITWAQNYLVNLYMKMRLIGVRSRSKIASGRLT
jgi:hypothetical protein